jgi:hypothetical protein
MRCSDSPFAFPRRSASASLGGTAATIHCRARGVSQVPGQPLLTCHALRPRWDPRALVIEDEYGIGASLFPAAFTRVRSLLTHAGVAFRSVPLSRRLAARGYCLPLLRRRRLPQPRFLRGSITRPIRSLSTLRRVGRPTTTQDSLPAGDHLCRDGTLTRRVASEVSALSTHAFSSPRLGLAQPR